MTRILILAIIPWLCVLCGIECVNVLGIFDSPSKSLHILGHALLRGLAKRGFNVTMLSAFPEEVVTPNYTHIQIDGLLKYKEDCYNDLIQGKLIFGTFSMIGFQKRTVQIALESKEIENLKKSPTKFDLIIQTYALNEAYLGLAHIFDVPVIAFVPFGGFPHINDLTANPAPYSYVPIPISKYTDDMNFFQRIGNTMMWLMVTLLHQYYFLPQQAELLEKYFPEAPPLELLLADKIDVVFVNSHISTETPRPYMPTVIQIGGYHIEESETLSPEFQNYMDTAQNDCYNDLIQGKLIFGTFSMIGFQKRTVQIALESKEIENLKKSPTKFDLIIQTYALNEAYLGLAHIFDVPVIAFVPFGGFPHINDLTANPAPYSYVPIPISKYTDDMNFFQRIGNTMMWLMVTLLHQYYFLPQQAELLEKYFPEAPPLELLLADKIDVVFVNSHISTETPRPYMPTVIQIGGYHIEESETLSPEFQNYMDTAQNGVVLFSFGTNINSSNLGNEKLDVFTSTFEKAEFRVLWKCEHSQRNTANVIMSKWLPQRAILSHPHVLAFISHGGLGSTTEALYHGVPLICISFFGDQFKNCEEAALHNYGIHLPYSMVTKAAFSKALDEIINNPRYRKSAKFRSTLFQDQPMKPMDKAVFWINHVIKYKGAKHFKAKAVSMPLYQYLLMDVLGFLVVVLGIFIFTSHLLIKMIYNNIFKVIKYDNVALH